jgi:hypothetical protein
MALNDIAKQFERRAQQHPGLGMILLVFDDTERVRRSTHISIVIHGAKPEDAVRMMREMADNIDQVERDSPIIQAPGPLVLKSS